MKPFKSLFVLIAFSLIGSVSHSAVPSSAVTGISFVTPEAKPTLSNKQQQLLYMKWFVTLSPKEYGKMRGRKLNFFEKASFTFTQFRMKQQLKSARGGEGEGVNWGGLALGAFLGLIGVVGAYIFSKDKNFIKWTWVGCGIFIVIFLIFVL